MGIDNHNEMWLKWKSLFLEVCDVPAPFHPKYVPASKSPWITSELKKLMYRRDRLKIKALRTGDPSDRSNFKKLRNEVNNSIKNAKKSYYYKTFETYNGNSCKTWETITEVRERVTFRLPFHSLALIIVKEVCHTAVLCCGMAYPWICVSPSLLMCLNPS